MSNTIDQQFVEFVVKTIVGNPDKVSIERSIDEKGVLLELTVDPEDLGRVIGKRGASAQAIRTLLRALGTKNDARYNLKIIDVSGGERPQRSEGSSQQDNRSSEEAPSRAVETEDTRRAEVVDSAPSVAEPTVEEPEEEPKEESSFEKARKELQDLDDLDI